MNKKAFISIFIILITILVIGVFFTTKKTSPTNIEGDVHEDRGGEKLQEEVVKKDDNEITSENIQEKQKDTKILYNPDGSINTSNWTLFYSDSEEKGVNFIYPSSWQRVTLDMPGGGFVRNVFRDKVYFNEMLENEVRVYKHVIPADTGDEVSLENMLEIAIGDSEKEVHFDCMQNRLMIDKKNTCKKYEDVCQVEVIQKIDGMSYASISCEYHNDFIGDEMDYRYIASKELIYQVGDSVIKTKLQMESKKETEINEKILANMFDDLTKNTIEYYVK